MSSRGGRGYNSRGGSRGSNYRDGGTSSYRGGSRGRSSNGSYNGGSSSSRGGRYNNGYENNYDSRGGSDRYSNRDDSYNKRNHGGYGGSRDRSPDRKRTRNDQGSRRNDTYGSSNYSSRNYEQYDKRDNRSSRNRSSPTRSFRSRDGSASSHRSREAMGPPKSLPLRSSRGSTYRGRGNSTRGGGGLRTTRGGVTRRTDISITRKRFNPTKSREYYTRMVKIAKMRRSLKNRASGENSSEERSVKTETMDEEEEWEKGTAETEKKSNSSSKKGGDAAADKEKDDETEIAEDGTTEVIKKTPTKKIKKEKNGSGDEVGTDKEEGVVSGDEVEGDDDKDATKEKSETIPKTRFTVKTFIKLTCIQCEIKCLTFKEYSNHLHGRTHKIAMRRLALRQKAQLSRMRLAQRNAQRDIEEKTDETLDLRPQFCLLCRLNYRQEKVKHQMSESHRNMKKFLMPFCSTCQINFKSPMMYEAHRCSLDHIMKKSRGESISDDDKVDEVQDIDLDNFMTVDSVGDVDGHDGEIDSSGENDTEGGEKKEEVNLGGEHVKKVEVYYCDLCRIYLNRKEDQEIALKKHCTMRSHLRAYVRYRDDRTLRKAAERIHKKHNESKQKETTKKDAVDGTKPEEKTAKEVPAAEDGKDGSEVGDDKMWEDVDKDLGELLREVGPSANNDDEDDEDSRLNSERYDRFRNSEKNNDAKEKKDIEEVEKISTIAETEEITKEKPESIENLKDDALAAE